MNSALRNLILFAATFFTVAKAPAATQTEVVAAVLWAEARGEGRVGVVAVAEVIRNRAKHYKSWASSPYQVVTNPKQFSSLNGLAPACLVFQAKTSVASDRLAWNYCLSVARQLEARTLKSNIANGATHYTVGTPEWARDMQLCAVIGNHNFFK